MRPPTLTVPLEPIAGPALDGLRSLLAAEHLPTDDLHDATNRFFALPDPFGGWAAVGGYALLADGVALLRSLVTPPEARGHGHGSVLLGALVAHLKQQGVREAFLITTDADRYFRRLGFEPVPRADVPASVRRTAQFSELCPSSAMVMRRWIQ